MTFSNRAAEHFLQDKPQRSTLKIGATPHSYDGSSYYRMWLPFTHMNDHSRHILGVAAPTPNGIGRKDVEGLDVLVMQRPCGPYGNRMLEDIVGHLKLVYEVDDDLLNAEAAGIPHLDDDRLRESVRRAMRLCDMVTVSCDHLAEIYRPFNENIVVLPNRVKAGMLDIHRPHRDKVTVGWAGGTSHLWDMVEIAEPLRRVLDANDVDMHFVGFDFSPLVHRHCRHTHWQTDVGQYYKQVDFDIAIAPSADQLFNRSKTPLRALEMGALGIPIVASNRLPYSDYVIDGKTGYLVNSEEEWETRLTELIHDADARYELGVNAKEQAAGHTIEEHWVEWEAAYEQAADI